MEKMIIKKCVLDLSGEAEHFVWVCTEIITANTYWKILKDCLTEAKERIPTKCRIGETFSCLYLSLEENYTVFTPKHMNDFHKDNKDLLYIIINTATNISEGCTVFYGGVKQTDLVKT